MSIREYLKSYKRQKSCIDYLMEKYNLLHEEALAIGGFDYSKDRISTSPKADASYTTIIEQCRDLEHQIVEEWKSWFQLSADIEQMIDTIPNSDIRLVLRYRYILLWYVPEISMKLNRSESSVKQLLYKGIEFLEENYEKM